MVFAVFKRSRCNRRKFLESHEYHSLVSAATVHEVLSCDIYPCRSTYSLASPIANYRLSAPFLFKPCRLAVASPNHQAAFCSAGTLENRVSHALPQLFIGAAFTLDGLVNISHTVHHRTHSHAAAGPATAPSLAIGPPATACTQRRCCQKASYRARCFRS